MTPFASTSLKILLLIAVIVSVPKCQASEEKVEVSHQLPTESAVSAVGITQCNHLLGIIATMANGDVVVFDSTSGVPFDAQVAWAQKAKKVVVVEAKCVISPGEFGS